MSKFWHIFTTIGVSALAIVTPQIQQVLVNHPKASGVILAIWTIIGNLVKSPTQG